MTAQERVQLFAAYAPCTCVYSDKDKGPYAIQGVSFSEEMALFEWDDDSDWWNITDQTKLLLTDLSLISEEHLIDVAKMAIGDTSEGYRFIAYDNPERFGFKGEMHKDIKCVGVDWFCKHPDIMDYRPMYLIQIDTVDFGIVKGYYNIDDGYKDDIPDNTVAIIDHLRSKGYNIGHGKYTAADLITEGVVVVDTKNAPTA